MTIKELCKKQTSCDTCPYLLVCRDMPEKYGSVDDLEVTNAIIETAKALDQEHILDKVKQARQEISDWDVNKVMDGCSEPFKLGVAKGLDIASEILNKMIESEE